jgi:hypothetical protein
MPKTNLSRTQYTDLISSASAKELVKRHPEFLDIIVNANDMEIYDTMDFMFDALFYHNIDLYDNPTVISYLERTARKGENIVVHGKEEGYAQPLSENTRLAMATARDIPYIKDYRDIIDRESSLNEEKEAKKLRQKEERENNKFLLMEAKNKELERENRYFKKRLSERDFSGKGTKEDIEPEEDDE